MKAAENAEENAIAEICPLCGSKMEKGYFAFASGAAWSNKKISNWSLKGLFSGEMIIGTGLGPFIYNIVANRCRKCRLIIFKYGDANESSKEGSP
ncbi:MAG: PF20097 family protein [Candidatus Bathyarchaeales archaeon]